MIKRFATMAGVVALLGLVVGIAGAYDDPVPTIKQAMGKLHKGATAALPTVKKALAAPTPDWAGIQTTTKLISDLSAAITEQEPPKGDKADYTRSSKAYAAEAKSSHGSGRGQGRCPGKEVARQAEFHLQDLPHRP